MPRRHHKWCKNTLLFILREMRPFLDCGDCARAGVRANFKSLFSVMNRRVIPHGRPVWLPWLHAREQKETFANAN